MDQVNALIRARMASEHAPRIPEVTAHLVEAGGKRLRPMLTLATAGLCDYDGPVSRASGGHGRIYSHGHSACMTMW